MAQPTSTIDTRDERSRRDGPTITEEPSLTSLMEYDPPRFSRAQEVKSDSLYELIVNFVGLFFGNTGLFPCCICCPNPYVSIEQGTVGMVSRFGKYYKTVDPGLVKVNPLSETLTTVDVRLQIHPISRIPIVTQDNVNIVMDAVLYWCIKDPYQATYGVVDVQAALVERAQTTLRAVLGGRELQDIIENREIIAEGIRDSIDVPAQAWGADVESVLFKDLTFSPELQESLSSAATQKRIGEARIIAARAEVESAKLMRQVAELLDFPAAVQFKYLETMQNMAKQPNSKLLFMPMAGPTPSETMIHAATSGSGEERSELVQQIMNSTDPEFRTALTSSKTAHEASASAASAPMSRSPSPSAPPPAQKSPGKSKDIRSDKQPPTHSGPDPSSIVQSAILASQMGPV
ncbi:hypothetical protein IWQ60_007666 [Tieghemiomyces parasiticus]|uniref:Band 7 domain-containing protein n=1 Tax=Tieghemiomyces parasiticus TaxID=78921 RepID=A0A9W7ZZX7_9FUNG|nr:hypothetical protein IWQ60_007666 [Tieghemiomyces parasiticus]